MAWDVPLVGNMIEEKIYHLTLSWLAHSFHPINIKHIWFSSWRTVGYISVCLNFLRKQTKWDIAAALQTSSHIQVSFVRILWQVFKVLIASNGHWSPICSFVKRNWNIRFGKEIFDVNLVWWDVGRGFEPQVGHLHSFLFTRGNFCQMLTSSNLNFWEESKKRKEFLSLLLPPYDFTTTLHVKLICRDSWNRTEQEEGTPHCVHLKGHNFWKCCQWFQEETKSRCAQVPANLQSNKLDARAPENHFGTTESWAVVPGPWTNLQQPPNLGILSVPALHLVLLLHQKALDQTLIQFTCSWRPSSSKPCI